MTSWVPPGMEAYNAWMRSAERRHWIAARTSYEEEIGPLPKDPYSKGRIGLSKTRRAALRGDQIAISLMNRMKRSELVEALT